MTQAKTSLLLATCAGILALSGSAFAADSSVVTVSATVTGTCKFVSPSYNMFFGTLDPSATSDATHTTTVAYQCTNGTPASSINVNGNPSPTTVPLLSLTSPTAPTLPVQMTWTVPATPGSGFGATAASIPVDITGTITAANLGTAVAGRYLTRATLTLMP